MSEQESTLDEFVETGSETDSNESQELFGLGKIPADWEIKPLSESAQIIPGNSPPSSTYNEKKDGLPFFQGNSNFGHFHPKADTWCSDPRKEAEINDVLMSIRAPVGDLNIADTHCCIGRGLAALRPNDLNGLYLYYNLAERKVWLSRLATGSTFKAVSKTDLQLLDVPLPTLSEQRKIATVLYTVDQAIEKIEEIIEQTEKIGRGLRQSLFTEGYYEHETESYGTLGEVPVSWEKSRLYKIADVARGKFTHRPRNDPEFYDGEYPFIQTGEVVEAVGELTDFSQTLNEKGRGVSKEFDPGTIIITIAGNIGDTAVATFPVYFPDSLVGITPDEETDERFLEHFLRYRQAFLNRLSTKTTQKNLNLTLLRPIEVVKPPLDEQKKIANTLSTVDNQIKKHNEYKNRLQRLKQSLMQDLLSGTVRTTDTNITVPNEVAQHG